MQTVQGCVQLCSAACQSHSRAMNMNHSHQQCQFPSLFAILTGFAQDVSKLHFQPLFAQASSHHLFCQTWLPSHFSELFASSNYANNDGHHLALGHCNDFEVFHLHDLLQHSWSCLSGLGNVLLCFLDCLVCFFLTSSPNVFFSLELPTPSSSGGEWKVSLASSNLDSLVLHSIAALGIWFLSISF